MLSLLLFFWSFSIFLNSSFQSCPDIWQPYIKFELNNEKLRVFNNCFRVKMSYFFQKPNPLSFFFSWLKYKFQSRCSLIVRPRYLICVFCGIYCLLILKFRCFVIFLLDLGLNSQILVLLVFKYILFALSHVVRRFKSWLLCSFIFFKELSTSSKLVSSAKWCNLLNFMAWFRSLMYIRKRSGPRTEPCGTPNSVKGLLDFWPLTVTCCFLLDGF